ncbi:DF family (seleno)protein [Micromonospora echinaurantiaca]|uniref:DF family (seleno)protein n=1 Tax=Micromonospora echinaurantiaca TaxID=47857 RepID=UPI0037950F3F
MIEILYFDGCPNHEGLDTRIRSLLAAAGIEETIVHRRIESDEHAQAERFLGSPTVLVNGVDVDPGATSRQAYGLTCRVYATDDGLRGTPPDEWIISMVQSTA